MVSLRNILPVDNGTGHSYFQETKDAPQELLAGMGGWPEPWVTRIKSSRTLAGGGHKETSHFLIWVVVIGVSTHVCWGPQDLVMAGLRGNLLQEGLLQSLLLQAA